MSFYGTIAGADAYHLARGNSAWADGTESAKSAALYRATAHIDGKYRTRFSGYRTDGRDQDLEWPRTDATDIEGNDIPTDEVPTEIINATYEGALRELASAGALSPDVTSTTGGIRRSREKVGPIEEETEYFEGASTTDPIFRRIDEILSGLFTIRRNTTSSFLLRA